MAQKILIVEDDRVVSKAYGEHLEREGFEVICMTAVAATIPFIIQKLRFRFGRAVSVGLVKKAKTASAKRAALSLARVKDWVLFGLPAICIWLMLLPTKKRYIGLYAIARKRD